MSDILDSLDELDEDIEYDFDDDEVVSGSFDLVEITDSDVDENGQMSEAKAFELTNAIKSAAMATHILLARAHAGKAYKALGYDTWADYVKTEFDLSAQRSYQLLDLSKVISAIEEVAPDGTQVKLTEAQARDIKRELPFITSQISEATEDMDSDEASKYIDNFVEQARLDKKFEDEALAIKEKNMQEAHQDGIQAGLEMATDAFLAQNPEDEEDGGFVEVEVAGGTSGGLSPQAAMDLHNFFNVLIGVTSMPEPDDVVAIIPENRRQEVNNQIEAAQGWFNRFAILWEAENS